MTRPRPTAIDERTCTMGIISRITSAIGSLFSGIVGAVKALIPGV